MFDFWFLDLKIRTFKVHVAQAPDAAGRLLRLSADPFKIQNQIGVCK